MHNRKKAVINGKRTQGEQIKKKQDISRFLYKVTMGVFITLLTLLKYYDILSDVKRSLY